MARPKAAPSPQNDQPDIELFGYVRVPGGPMYQTVKATLRGKDLVDVKFGDPEGRPIAFERANLAICTRYAKGD